METLARIHAPWWGRISSHEYGWIPTLDAPRIQAVSQVYPMLWQGFVAKFADMLPPGAAEAGDLIASRWGELMAALAKRPMTLLHQDFRCDNLFFDDANAGDAVVVIDWQAIGRGPGAYDLAYSLGGSLTVDDRRSNELALIRRYYDVLIAEGASNYSFEELWRDYQFATMVVTATPIFVGSQLDMANERGRGLIGGMGHRMFSNVVDHNATIQIGT